MNPILTGGADYALNITTCPPPDFHTFLQPWQVELLFFYGNAHSINVNGFENKQKKKILQSNLHYALHSKQQRMVINCYKTLTLLELILLHDEQNLEISKLL